MQAMFVGWTSKAYFIARLSWLLALTTSTTPGRLGKRDILHSRTFRLMPGTYRSMG